jgi:hypothetical protein
MAANADKTSYRLISGVFSPAEAKKVLMSLILDKINFHHKSNWSHKERFGEPDLFSVKRMKELNQTRAELITLIEDADSAGQHMAINCAIEITLSPAATRGESKLS